MPQSPASADPSAHGLQPLRLIGDDGAMLLLYPYGAHLCEWRPAGEARNRLFVSTTSAYRAGTAIRGGVPVIFPQFATEGPLPRHGFARTQVWTLLEAGGSCLRLRLTDSIASRALWPATFVADLELAAQGRELRMQLQVQNCGDAPLQFTVALHTYLRVEDIGAVRVEGLQGRRYRDSAAGCAICIEEAPMLAIDGEVDRIYFDTPGELTLREPQYGLRILQQGFRDTVIWNPGAERAAALTDMEPEGWRHMLCVEAATIGAPVVLEAGARWQGAQVLVAA